MRIVLITVVGAAALLLAPRAGAAHEGPWCAIQDIGHGMVVENCSLWTFEQCRMEVIAGNRGICVKNIRWPGWHRRIEPPGRSRRARRR